MVRTALRKILLPASAKRKDAFASPGMAKTMYGISTYTRRPPRPDLANSSATIKVYLTGPSLLHHLTRNANNFVDSHFLIIVH